MFVYRIVKDRSRSRDLSGTGAFKSGGRWNSKGTFMLYTSESSSLALLEVLVHFDKLLMPPQLMLTKIEVEDSAPVYKVPDNIYPSNWEKVGLIANQKLGDKWMKEQKYLAVKIRSAVNPEEYNYLLNPLFPELGKLVKVVSITGLKVDSRLK